MPNNSCYPRKVIQISGGYKPVDFPSSRPVTRSFDVFFDPNLNTNGCANNQYACDLRRHRAHDYVTVMRIKCIRNCAYYIQKSDNSLFGCKCVGDFPHHKPLLWGRRYQLIQNKDLLILSNERNFWWKFNAVDRVSVKPIHGTCRYFWNEDKFTLLNHTITISTFHPWGKPISNMRATLLLCFIYTVIHNWYYFSFS